MKRFVLALCLMLSATLTAAATPDEGTKLATIAEKYLVESVVGEGGFAVVYRALHTVWKRPVAIKVFKALSEVSRARRQKLLDDFIREGALLAELSERYDIVLLDSPPVLPVTDPLILARLAGERLGAQLPYIFLVSRLAHYLKCVQRERIGTWSDRSALERELELWLRQFVSDQDDAQWEVRARRPLRRASVLVEEVAGQTGWYRCRLQLQPHLTHNSASFTLSLFGKLDRPAAEGAA